jgi:hypothetical protein
MSLVDRLYPDIARDMLTTVTGGIAAEQHTVTYTSGELPAPVPIVLKRRPVQRVSSLQGVIETTDGNTQDYVFNLNDYELVGSSSPDALDTIRFVPFGRRPKNGSTLTVNYYPRDAEPTVLTDVQVGSVVRTLLESVAKEMAALYAQMNLAYDAAFLETATGASLDRVVALLGFRRLRAGRATGFATFTRRAGTPGDITIPAGTPITDGQDKIRYETTETHLMRGGESTAQVRIRGTAESTPVVEANTLTVISRLVAGLSDVTNERPTTRANEDESDDDLRLRARGAFTSVDKGTIESLRRGLLQLDDVRDVLIDEMPDGIAGEVRLKLSLAPNANETRINAHIEELRPAGIRVSWKPSSLALQVRVKLILAGSALPSTERMQLQKEAADRIVNAVNARGIGETIRIQPLVAAILSDARIVDAKLELGPRGGALGTSDLKLEATMAATLEKDGVTFDTPEFDRPADGITRVEVTAAMGIALVHHVQFADAESAIRAKLEAFLAALTAGTVVDAQALLNALRDDSKFGIDPLTLSVLFAAGAEGVLVTMNGRAMNVKADHQFTLASLTVEPRGTRFLAAPVAATLNPQVQA